MILKFVKKPVGEKKGEDNEETTVPSGEEKIASDQSKTNLGKEQMSFDGNQDKDAKKKIGPGYEVSPDDDDFQGRVLLAEAVRMRYLPGDVFDKQEKYIEHLWDHRFCPERWPLKITNLQENAIMQIVRAVRRWIKDTPSNPIWIGIWKGASEEDKARFRQATKLVELLFAQDYSDVRGRIDEDAVGYEPIQINVHRGDPLYCPRTFLPKDIGAIKRYFSLLPYRPKFVQEENYLTVTSMA